ncbi:MAG: PfkB family carbohydrate kinase [Anaerolineae bacterium]|nr:PfkB family carbohydrate kinase [Anaerolineae bacterium]
MPATIKSDPEPLSVVAAGHLCLDIIPDLHRLQSGEFNQLFKPGRLIQTGTACFSTGGPVSNTGLALYLLGINVKLNAKIGDDPFGRIVTGLVAHMDPLLNNGIKVDPNVATSYTFIINPPDVDRIFLHCTGANDVFCAADVAYDLAASSRLFHFGYPPIMRQMYLNQGAELLKIMRRVKSGGTTTSLDLTFPDPSSESGRADWRAILSDVLPFVDLFMPSFEEIYYMLHRDEFEYLNARGALLDQVTPQMLSELSRELLDLGVAVAALKLGGRGLYVHCASYDRLQNMGFGRPENYREWAGKQVWSPCFAVDVAGTTGSGDATIAGFISGLLRGLSLEASLRMAVAVGACNVEAADALSGLCSWENTAARVATGWPQRPMRLTAPGWFWNEIEALWFGPLS